MALFLDDLQWLDAATLDLLEDLLTQPDVQHLMSIGAYRDNEVNSAHPLIRKLATIRQAGGAVQEIVLAPLAREELGQLIADSLHCELERASPLVSLVHDKTGGNPFFGIQFITALAEEGLLIFDYGAARWSWDLNRIRAKGYTDNVVDLMVAKLNRLPVETQNALQQLACLGNTAQFALLAIISEDSEEEIHRKLWEAVRIGLVLRSEDSYRFLHDRVQEAAYSLIPEELRAEAHLQIGRLLAAQTPPEKREEAIFEIVNQFNRGSHLIRSAEERERVAELNLIAGRRAKVSTAYVSALSYLAAGRALLTEDSWADNYELVFSIEIFTAECELLTADMVAAENRLSMLSQRARSAHHIAIVTRLRLTLYQTMDRSDRAVEVCLEYLRRGGTDWSLHPTSDEARREYDRIWSQLGNREIEELVDLPLMTNPDVLDALDVLGEVVTPAKCCDLNLLSLVACRMVNLSLEHGNSDGSCFAYVWFAIVAGPCFGNYRDGFRFGRLGYELVEKRGLTRYQARTYMCFGNIVMPWAKHARSGRDLIRRAFDVANRMGDLTFTAYCRDELISNFLTVGDPLAEVQQEAENALAFVQKARFGLIVDIIIGQVGFIRTLRGLTPKFGYFNDEAFDELQFERHLASNPVLMLADFWYCTRKTQARFLAGDYAAAVAASLRAQQLLWTSPSQFETAEFRFYGALSHAAAWDSASPDQRQQHFEALAAYEPTIAQEEILAALSQIKDPDLGRDIVTLGFVKDLRIDGGNVSFAIELTTPACPVRDQMKEDAHRAVRPLPGVERVEVRMGSKVRATSSEEQDKLVPLVKNVVPVGSGKGGVGKSTVSANLAIALAKLGAKVGLMDADIYGPSIPTIMGAHVPPTAGNGKIVPVLRYGVEIVSIGFFVPKGEATILRGPMLSKMVEKFLGGVEWGELDYLLVDLPPGTGDVQLSLCQMIPLTGAAVVSTPQDLAFNVAEKAISMFNKLRTPILGLVENMSGFECRHCGHREEIFGSGGARRFAMANEIPFLGEIPLYGYPHDFRRGISHRPVDARLAQCPRLRAGRREPRGAGQHPHLGGVSSDRPEIAEITRPSTSDVRILWKDGHESLYTGYALRVGCRCAVCVDEMSGNKRLREESISKDVRPLSIDPVGRYAIRFQWSDGHSTGIYTFELLRELCPCPICAEKSAAPTR